MENENSGKLNPEDQGDKVQKSEEGLEEEGRQLGELQVHCNYSLVDSNQFQVELVLKAGKKISLVNVNNDAGPKEQEKATEEKETREFWDFINRYWLINSSGVKETAKSASDPEHFTESEKNESAEVYEEEEKEEVEEGKEAELGQTIVPENGKNRKFPRIIRKHYYQHDDRQIINEGEEENGKEKSEEKLKNLAIKDTDLWKHDRFEECDQAPKSQDELAAVYGYNIRGKDQPPRAPRRMRYGSSRGPSGNSQKQGNGGRGVWSPW